VTADDFRTIALAMPGAVESAHMSHPDFRVGGRIVATLGSPNRDFAMVKVTPDQQEFFLRSEPQAFAAASGAWGRQGCTLVRLKLAPVGLVQTAVREAWELHHAKQPKKPRKPR
jgi:hypothetical protein